MTSRRIKRVEKDPTGAWIARRRDGSTIPEADFRWNNRSAARGAVIEDDILERDAATWDRQAETES